MNVSINDPIPQVTRGYDYVDIALAGVTIHLSRWDVAHTLADIFRSAGDHLDAAHVAEARRLGRFERSVEDAAAAREMNAEQRSRRLGPFGTLSHAVTTQLGRGICAHPECGPTDDGGEAA
jgi:hypothetical protein